MTEPAGPGHDGSIVARADKVHAAANTLLAGEQRRSETERVLKRVADLQRALEELGTAVAAARRLTSASGTELDLSGATKGQARFADEAHDLPPDPVFVRARRAVTGAANRIAESTAVEWMRWTTERLDALPLQRVVVLPEDQRTDADRRTRQLRSLARSAPSTSDIAEFQTTYDLLAETLAVVADPPDGVLAVLQQLAAGASIRLGDLSDDQVSLLRVSGIADQIELRRSRT